MPAKACRELSSVRAGQVTLFPRGMVTGMDDVPAVESTCASCDPLILVVAKTGLTSVVANADTDADRRYEIWS